MSNVVLASDQYFNCPICGQTCLEEAVDAHNTVLNKQGKCQSFLCINPLAGDELHYYNHIVDRADPNKIAYLEFSIDIGNRFVMFGIDLTKQKTLIKDKNANPPLEVDLVIMPDFPYLHSLKKKIRTAITFS